MFEKGVIGTAYPKIFKKLRVAREKLIYGVKQEGFSETAGPGRKKLLCSDLISS
jgi:hypothetical protein